MRHLIYKHAFWLLMAAILAAVVVNAQPKKDTVQYQYFLKIPLDKYIAGQDTITRSFEAIAADYDLPEDIRVQLFQIRKKQAFSQLNAWFRREYLDSVKVQGGRK